MSNNLGENITISIWKVLASIPVVVGAIFWLSTIYVDEQAHGEQIRKIDGRIDSEYTLLLDIRDRVIRLESSKGNK